MTPPPDDSNDELATELRWLARSRPKSGREAAAKASALRTLERLGVKAVRKCTPERRLKTHPL
jgi:hypothetical protein